MYDKVRGKVLFVRLVLLTSAFNEFGVTHVPAFIACWGDKKLKKIENQNTKVFPPDDIEWWGNNKDEVQQMVDKLESKKIIKNKEILNFFFNFYHFNYP